MFSNLCTKSDTVFLVRESSHTMALQIGLPVFRLQTTVVSRWLVIPTEERIYQVHGTKHAKFTNQ